ncbi:alpha/beta fold hydrolase [Kiritimatiellaeota bacterium B1221]|nr:alpha/beta fold hydrolase [Kiritimatiellaeota bacterium B1221]
MNARYDKWNKSVTRTPEGILTFSQAQTYGEGKNALVLIHGFGDGPHVWKTLAPALAEKGYYVSAIRLPGWGEPLDVKRQIEIEDWENCIRNEIGHLRKDHPHVAVMAHSMGACISTVMAQAGTLNADALVLYAPMLEVSSERSPLFKTRTWYKIGSKILPRNMIIESVFPDHARVNAPRPKTERDPFTPKQIYDHLYTEMDRFEAQPAQSPLPVRLVLPGKDRVVSNERSQRWFNDLEAPDKILFIEEPAGHVLPLDVDVLAESDRLVVWLNKQGITP